MQRIVLAGLLALSASARAHNMASNNYQNDWNVIDAGGGDHSSGAYKMYDALFQTGIGSCASGNFSVGQAGMVQDFDTPTVTASATTTPTMTATVTPTSTFTPTITDT